MSDGIIYGDYYLLGRLNAGGMAEVFLGKSLAAGESDELLAIKRMLPKYSADREFATMFGDEARIARRLHHGNICEVHDEGRHNDQLFIVMEFIHGKDLKVVQHRARQRGEPIPPRVVALVIAKVAEALDYAHTKKSSSGEPESIIHRDVSPQNILISYDGVAKLIDFGIAKAKNRVVQTRVGVIKGKYGYMSPEQATGMELDPRSDIFSLGVVLYELLAGKPPFSGANEISTLKKIARCDYMPVQLANGEVPPRLADIVHRALALHRDDRYPRAMDMAGDLMRYLRESRQSVDESVLSAYMRKLFRDDYVRETARIKVFRAMQPPSRDEARQVPAPQPVRGGGSGSEHTTPGDDTEANMQAMILAAGYSGPDTDVSGSRLAAEEDSNTDLTPIVPDEETTGADLPFLGPETLSEPTKVVTRPVTANPFGDEPTEEQERPRTRASAGFLDDPTREIAQPDTRRRPALNDVMAAIDTAAVVAPERARAESPAVRHCGPVPADVEDKTRADDRPWAIVAAAMGMQAVKQAGLLDASAGSDAVARAETKPTAQPVAAPKPVTESKPIAESKSVAAPSPATEPKPTAQAKRETAREARRATPVPRAVASGERPLLTRRERIILAIAAGIGAGIITISYLYASYAPLPDAPRPVARSTSID